MATASPLDGLRPPVFIIGNPRSGTTLLRLMVTCHPAIVVPPECGFAVFLAPRFEEWHQRRTRELVDAVLAARKFDTWGLDPAALLAFLTEQRPASYADACALIYVFYGRSLGRAFQRFGDKNNFHVNHVEDIARLWPDARFLHIVRDGRNVATSYLALADRKIDSAYRPELPTDIATIAAEWKANIERARAGFDVVGHDRVLEVIFEQLVQEPERVLQGVCAHLNEPWSPDMLDYPARNREQQLEPRELMQWKQRTLEPPDRSVVDKYRRELSAGDVARFEEVAGEILREYGFPTGSGAS